MTELDNETLNKAKIKDKNASLKLYEFYMPFLWKVIYRTVNGNKDLAEEILQETFIRIFCNLKKFNGTSTFSTWLFRIAYTTSVAMAVKENRHKLKISNSMHSSDIQEKKASPLDRLILCERLKILSTEERFLLLSHEVSGISFIELSEICKKTPGSLRTAIFRIKEKLGKEEKIHVAL